MVGKILVTGATGAVGSEVVKQLVTAGASVRAAVHTASKGELFKQFTIETTPLDYARPETFPDALQGVDKVFFVGFASPAFAALSRDFALAARQAGVTHLVKLSAFGADFAPEFLIAHSHRQSEAAIEATGIAFTHLRPNVFMQNLINYYGHSIKHEGKFYLAQGDGRVSFIDVRDVGAAAVTVLTQPGHEGKGYSLTGDAALSYAEVAAVLSKAAEKPIQYVALSEEEALRRARAAGQPDFFIEVGRTMDAFGRAGGFASVTNECELLTGRKPITLEQFAKDYSQAFQ